MSYAVKVGELLETNATVTRDVCEQLYYRLQDSPCLAGNTAFGSTELVLGMVIMGVLGFFAGRYYARRKHT